MSADTSLEDKVVSVINTLVTVYDPRLIVNTLLVNAAALAQLVLFAEKATPAQVANAFSGAMVQALTPRQAESANEPRIEIVGADVLPRRQ